MPGEFSRRKFLEMVGAGVLASVIPKVALGQSSVVDKNKPKEEPKEQEYSRELTEAQKKEWGEIIKKVIDDNFYWVRSPEFKQQSPVIGRENIVAFLSKRLAEKKPKVFVFGEFHHDPTYADLFIDIIEKDPSIKMIAEESVDYTSTEEINRGILTGAVPRDPRLGAKDYLFYYTDIDKYERQQRIKRLAQERGISFSILQHPFAPNKEINGKVLGLVGEDETVAIYCGGYHAAIGRGNERSEEEKDLMIKSDESNTTETYYGVLKDRAIKTLVVVPESIMFEKEKIVSKMRALANKYVKKHRVNIISLLSQVDKSLDDLDGDIEKLVPAGVEEVLFFRHDKTKLQEVFVLVKN